MPIYAYKCSSCAQAQDVLQKLSAAPLTECPVCGKSTYSKQITAPQFQLKGSGWYVTDFRGGNTGKKDGESDSKSEPAKADAKTAAVADSNGKGETKSEPKTESAASRPANSPPAPAPSAAPVPAKPATKE